MLNMYLRARNYLVEKQEGATAVEYGIMVGLIAVVIIAAVVLLGKDLKAMFTDVETQLGGTTSTTTTTT